MSLTRGILFPLRQASRLRRFFGPHPNAYRRGLLGEQWTPRLPKLEAKTARVSTLKLGLVSDENLQRMNNIGMSNPIHLSDATELSPDLHHDPRNDECAQSVPPNVRR